MGDGPFTVFAPNDEAFAKLPEGTIESLLKDIPTLKNILLYRVVSGEYMAEDVLGMRSLTALNGGQLMINPTEVKIQGSGIIVTDIIAANGVIHVIDTVMIP